MYNLAGKTTRSRCDLYQTINVSVRTNLVNSEDFHECCKF